MPRNYKKSKHSKFRENGQKVKEPKFGYFAFYNDFEKFLLNFV